MSLSQKEWARAERSAVRSGRVLAVECGLPPHSNRPGPQLSVGLQILAGIIHPEIIPAHRRPGRGSVSLNTSCASNDWPSEFLARICPSVNTTHALRTV